MAYQYEVAQLVLQTLVAVTVAFVTLALAPMVLAHLLTPPFVMTMMFPSLLLIVGLVGGINLLIVLLILLLVGRQWRVDNLSYRRAVIRHNAPGRNGAFIFEEKRNPRGRARPGGRGPSDQPCAR